MGQNKGSSSSSTITTVVTPHISHSSVYSWSCEAKFEVIEVRCFKRVSILSFSGVNPISQTMHLLLVTPTHRWRRITFRVETNLVCILDLRNYPAWIMVQVEPPWTGSLSGLYHPDWMNDGGRIPVHFETTRPRSRSRSKRHRLDSI